MNMCLSDEHAHALSSEILFPMHNKLLRTQDRMFCKAQSFSMVK